MLDFASTSDVTDCLFPFPVRLASFACREDGESNGGGVHQLGIWTGEFATGVIVAFLLLTAFFFSSAIASRQTPTSHSPPRHRTPRNYPHASKRHVTSGARAEGGFQGKDGRPLAKVAKEGRKAHGSEAVEAWGHYLLYLCVVGHLSECLNYLFQSFAGS